MDAATCASVGAPVSIDGIESCSGYRLASLLIAGVGLGLLASCGSDDAGSAQSLPPISTTTTTTVPTSTTDPRIKLYELKPGESLAMVAAAFNVPLSALIEQNSDKISDPNNVPVGVMLEIPPYLVVDELPTVATSAP